MIACLPAKVAVLFAAYLAFAPAMLLARMGSRTQCLNRRDTALQCPDFDWQDPASPTSANSQNTVDSYTGESNFICCVWEKKKHRTKPVELG